MNERSALMAMICLVLVSCGSAGDAPVGVAPDAPVSDTPGVGISPNRGPQRVEARDGLVDIRATTFDRSAPRAKGKAIDLFFWSGIEECYGVDRVEVEYANKTVTATIFEGREANAQTCIELAVRKVVRVQLTEPLGGRTVVDGEATSKG